MKPVKVLIAEDDFRVADLHEKFLKRLETVDIVAKTATAQATLDILNQTPVDLLLLDIYMPDQLGTDILTMIHEQFPKVDVVMITAATDKRLLEKALRNGVHSYLIKPVTMERFHTIIQDYIKKRELLGSTEEVDQQLIDKLLGSPQSPPLRLAQTATLPKGIDALTLNKVFDILHSSEEGFSSERVGQLMGASRTTARRYLEYLISTGQCRAELIYGIVGRPERHYYAEAN